MYWYYETDIGFKGYIIDYKSIALHAVVEDTNFYEHPCLYCQVIPNLQKKVSTQDDSLGEILFVPNSELNYIFLYYKS